MKSTKALLLSDIVEIPGEKQKRGKGEQEKAARKTS